MSKISKEEEKQLRISPNMHPVPTDKKLRSTNIPLIGYVAFVVILIVGLVGTAKTMGWYGTSGKVSSSGQAITITASSTGADLKGWMTLDSFLKAFGITKKQFETEFKVSANLDAAGTLGELGAVTSEVVSMETLRAWVDAGHKLGGLVSTNSTTTSETPAASASPSASVTPSASSTPSTHVSVPSSATPTASVKPSPTGSQTGTGVPSNTDSTGAFIIKGRTTIQEVLTQTKFPKADFYAKFKIPETFPASGALSTIKEVVPNFEITVIQDWYATLK